MPCVSNVDNAVVLEFVRRLVHSRNCHKRRRRSLCKHSRQSSCEALCNSGNLILQKLLQWNHRKLFFWLLMEKGDYVNSIQRCRRSTDLR